MGATSEEVPEGMGHAFRPRLLEYSPVLSEYEQTIDAKVLEWKEAIYSGGGVCRSDYLQAPIHVRSSFLQGD